MTAPAQSLACAWETSIPLRLTFQRSARASCMPMARMTSAFCIVAPANSEACWPSLLAAKSAFRVKYSLRSAKVKITTVPPSATQPSQGWKAKHKARKIGVQGTSKNASTPWPVIKLRTLSASPRAERAPLLGLTSCIRATRSKRGRDRMLSNCRPARTSMRERTNSNMP